MAKGRNKIIALQNAYLKKAGKTLIIGTAIAGTMLYAGKLEEILARKLAGELLMQFILL